ncbi:hypothetical protein CU014_1343 [Enterococcus xinjiangensis]|nr:hypothetical protein [Enterococcus lactis]
MYVFFYFFPSSIFLFSYTAFRHFFFFVKNSFFFSPYHLAFS